MNCSLPQKFDTVMIEPQGVNGISGLLEKFNLHTVCQSAQCPNLGECFALNTATFLILGNICTRHCTFCAVEKGYPEPLDVGEPQHILEMTLRLNLTYVVITSVTRDDVSDGGASQFARVIDLFHRQKPDTSIEILIPDLKGSNKALRTVVEAGPEVINHNVETVPRLYRKVRPEANYNRSIELLYSIKEMNPGIVTKSGIMLGLGETKDEVIEVMHDLREAGCDLLTIGQYLRPSPYYRPVLKYIRQREFDEYSSLGRELGFRGLASGRLVRSSYKAMELYQKVKGGGY